MYINTRIVHARPNNGWYGLIDDCAMQFASTYNPASLSFSGRQRLRTWMRKGFADRPTGELCAKWTLLMYGLGARYIMIVGPSSIPITFFTKHKIETQHEELRAHVALMNAANDGGNRVGINRMDQRTHDQVVLPHVGRQTRAFTTMLAPYGVKQQLATTAVNTFGHPLDDVEKALAYIDEPHHFKFDINHTFRRRSSEPSSTTTTVSFGTVTTIKEAT